MRISSPTCRLLALSQPPSQLFLQVLPAPTSYDITISSQRRVVRAWGVLNIAFLTILRKYWGIKTQQISKNLIFFWFTKWYKIIQKNGGTVRFRFFFLILLSQFRSFLLFKLYKKLEQLVFSKLIVLIFQKRYAHQFFLIDLIKQELFLNTIRISFY